MTRNSLSIVLVNLLVMAGAADAVETIDKSAEAPRFPFSADDARRYQNSYAKSLSYNPRGTGVSPVFHGRDARATRISPVSG